MDNTSLSLLFRNIHLENTRLLVKGIEVLHRGYQELIRGDNSLWKLDKIQEFLIESYRASVQNGKFLHQNPYVELFRFRCPNPNEQWMKTCDSFHLSGMILFYHQLQILENISSDLLAEAYEILCNSIRRILDADMCYLVSRKMTDIRILCASSVMEKDLDKQLGNKEAGVLLNQLSLDEYYSQLVEGVFLKRELETTENDHDLNLIHQPGVDTLVLPIVLYDTNGKLLETQIYLICQRRDKPLWVNNPTDTLSRVRDTLFLRGQFAQTLSRDLTSLITTVSGYRDIRRRTSENSPLRILHISDLHVTNKNFKQLKESIQKLSRPNKPFDFLVITGDVVQGRMSAGYLEQHYDCAAQVIRRIAFQIWGEKDADDEILRQDWKRRTLIIPGNHDYASMNELETQHGDNHRASESGRPATQEGSAMAKFTYYINFIRKLLDIEVGELIDNDLNELRRYDKMGVDFLCFNTSIMANPARNNKVHLDHRFAQHTIQQLSLENTQRIIIFLGHHGPDYTIDYVSDEYLEPYICRKITDGFVKAIATEQDQDRKSALINLIRDLETLDLTNLSDEIENDFVQLWLSKNKMTICPNDVTQKVISCRKNTRLYNHLTFLVEQLEKDEIERCVNERYQKIIAELNHAKLLSDNDSRAYAKVFQMLSNKLNLTVCLAGHTHEWDSLPNYHYVAKRFYSERPIRKSPNSCTLEKTTCLHYGVCEIMPPRTGIQAEVQYQRVDEHIS